MGNIQDPHISPPPRSPLFHHIGSRVECPDETHRPAGYPPGRPHHIPLRPQAAEREPRSPPALMDQRRFLDLVEDPVQRILHRQHKARRKLLQLPPRVHQGRRIGQQLQPPHRQVKPFLRSRPFRLARPVQRIRLRQIAGHPPEQTVGVLRDIPVAVFGQIPPPQHHLRVSRNFPVAPVNPPRDPRLRQRRGDPAAAFRVGVAHPRLKRGVSNRSHIAPSDGVECRAATPPRPHACAAPRRQWHCS